MTTASIMILAYAGIVGFFSPRLGFASLFLIMVMAGLGKALA